MATAGLGLASLEEAEAPCQAWETTGERFMSHTEAERSARAVSRYLASSPIPPAGQPPRVDSRFGGVGRWRRYGDREERRVI